MKTTYTSTQRKLRTKYNLKCLNLLDKEKISVQKLYSTANQNYSVINN